MGGPGCFSQGFEGGITWEYSSSVINKHVGRYIIFYARPICYYKVKHLCVFINTGYLSMYFVCTVKFSL
jgi:hypothetical protein